MRGLAELRSLLRPIHVAKALALGLAAASPAHAAEKLGSFPVDPGQLSVAGFSSGAFMANQLHVAHSAEVMGAAMIAGGLYGCAVQEVTSDGVAALASQAFGPCVRFPSMLNDVATYKHRLERLAAKGWIDSPSNLARARVYFFTGGSDALVAPEVVEKGKALYDALGVPAGAIVFEDRSGPAAKAGHSWVTKTFGAECSSNKAPFVNNCLYDQAGAELNAIYGPNLQLPAATASGRIVAFDQAEFVPQRAAGANGLSDTGYLYVPRACEQGAAGRCRLQVLLHGCTQSAEVLGDLFMTKIGVNEWADANRILVLYPQAHATTPAEMRGFRNANSWGCWNWWGYSDDRRYLTRSGVQISAIWGMIQRLEGK